MFMRKRKPDLVAPAATAAPDLTPNPWNIIDSLPDYTDKLTLSIPNNPQLIPIPMDFCIPGEAYHPADPLSPPPHQFDRQVPAERNSDYFRPLTMYALDQDLCRGVYPVYPIMLQDKDVWQDDWTRFIEDLVVSARYPGLPGRDSRSKQLYKTERYPKVLTLLDHWNLNFFNKRGIHILLKQSTFNPQLYLISLNQTSSFPRPQPS